jgi:predicted SAM-dependent methyltransferase
MIAEPTAVEAAIPDGPRLNVGSGPSAPDGWTSLDGSWQARLAGRPWLARLGRRLVGVDVGHWPRGVEYCDIRRGLGAADGSVAVVYASHVLEHLHRDDASRFLSEARRALKAGGICRVVVPDLHAIVTWYLAHREEPSEGRTIPSSDLLMDLLMLRARGRRNGNRLLAAARRAADLHEHKWMYDGEGLVALFAEAGFVRPRARGYLDSAIPRDVLQRVEREDRVCRGAGVCVEARK